MQPVPKALGRGGRGAKDGATGLATCLVAMFWVGAARRETGGAGSNSQ
jgi:hypothetical protein